MQERFALGPVDLPRLTTKQLFDLRKRARGEDPAADHEGLEPGRRVSPGSVEPHDHALELLLAPGGEQRGPLQRSDASANADRSEITGERLTHRVERRIRIEVAGIESIREAGLGQEVFGLGGIVGWRFEREREFEAPRDDRAGRSRETEGLGLVHGITIDREAGGMTDALVVPR